MRVYSPVPKGSGVEVLHRSLAEGVPDYHLDCYSPWWQLFPPGLAAFADKSADLVHTSADYGYFLKRPGVPLVATVHNYTSDRFMRDYSSRLQYLHYRSDLRLFSHLTMNTATVLVAISRFMADIVDKELQPSSPVRLIYNGIDEKRFVPARTKKLSSRFRVLFCGNLNRRKRANLLEPLARVLGKEFEVRYTAGLSNTSHDATRSDSEVAAMRPLGRVAYKDMPMVYHEADVLLMPSIREGFGLCVAEAMACGLPVVACGESATPELVVDRRGGYLCPVDDLRCYANAIRTLAENPQTAKTMGEFNRARVEELFTLNRMRAEYQALFEAVLNGEFND